MPEEADRGRRLRPKEKRTYQDDTVDDEIEGKRTFTVEDKLESDKYSDDLVKVLNGQEFSLKYFQEHGFMSPILIKDKTGLGLRVPSENFKVSDVKQCVGSRRQLDVMDVSTQKGMSMTMKEWCKYYECKERDRLLNVISLEFSHTKLETYVEQPTIVREIDWVDTVWPRHLKEHQTESTNLIERMKYPKVQKYCLMSVSGCYTDFHIDMGGTSVWYHILHGAKIFWLVPPTERNLEAYENWLLSGKQTDVFFADEVDTCQRIKLEPGWTFFIPTGWIHAVYTPADSLVFGGNYLHSYNIPMQLRCVEIEDKTHVPNKFRYPFFNEIHWYMLERYVSCLTGKHHRIKSEEELMEERKDHKSCFGIDGNNSDDSQCSERQSRSRRNSEDSHRTDESPPRTPHWDGYVSSPRPDTPKSPSQATPGSPALSRSPRPGTSEPKSPSCKAKLEKPKLAANGGPSPKPSSFCQSDLIKPVSVKLENCIRPVSIKLENCALNPDKYMNEQNGNDAKNDATENTEKPWVHLTEYELLGLRRAVTWLENLPPLKKFVPVDIPDPEGLIKDMKMLLKSHEDDDRDLSVNGSFSLKWPSRKVKLKSKTYLTPGFKAKKVSKAKGKEGRGSVRRRRVRCKKCEPCTRSECGECTYCKDMKKFGGPGRMKQTCISRQCMAPVIPSSCQCLLCGKDERVRDENTSELTTTLMECGRCWEIVHPNCLSDKNTDVAVAEVEPIINEDLPNSWECPKCCVERKDGEAKVKGAKSLLAGKRSGSRQSSTCSDTSTDVKFENEQDSKAKRRSIEVPNVSKNKVDKAPQRPKRGRVLEHSSTQDEVSPKKKIKPVAVAAAASPTPLTPSIAKNKTLSAAPTKKMCIGASGGLIQGRVTSRGREADCPSKWPGKKRCQRSRAESPEPSTSRECMDEDGDHEMDIKTEAFETCSTAGTEDEGREEIPKLVIKIEAQKYVIRPAPIPAPPKHLPMEGGGNHILEHEVWYNVFRYLPPNALGRCMLVCKTWNRWCIDKRLWACINLSRKRIRQQMLIGLVRRQPTSLDLSWTNINRKQLSWLMARLPHIKHLSLAGNSWAAICALCSSTCPLLHTLDLQWTQGVRDNCIKDLVSLATDHRPGLDETLCRLHRLKRLNLAGTDVSDEALQAVVRYLLQLTHLDLSYCTRVTNIGMKILTASRTGTRDNIVELNLTGCHQLTDDSFQYFGKLKSLELLFLHACPNFTDGGCKRFVSERSERFILKEERLIQKI